MIFSFLEIIYLIITIFVVGYIFSGFVNLGKTDLIYKKFDWEKFKFAALVASPGIILHELSHKFVAMGFGLKSVFQIYPVGLVIGVLLKLLGSGFILLAPGYVSTFGATNIQGSLIAFAGPAVNGLLWLAGFLFVKYSKKHTLFWVYIKEINKWLFIFNLLPIPPLDGYKAYGHLFF